MRYRVLTLLSLLAMAVMLCGCPFHLFGAMAGAAESQKKVEKHARYYGLEGKSVAVVVDADLSILYEHPDLVGTITSGVSEWINRDVIGTTMVPAAVVLAWQWRTPQWNAMPYGELIKSLNVDRVVLIDIYEYRLNPPGNRWLWEGVCAANVSVIEADAFDPDMPVGPFDVIGEYPKIKGVDRDSATEQRIELGVLAEFIKKTAWLFYKHIEPKYPDRYRPELDAR